MGSLAFGQTNFGGSSGSSGSSSGSTSLSQEFPLGSLDTDTRFFTGNEALNGGLVGAGLGALGATILGPAGAQWATYQNLHWSFLTHFWGHFFIHVMPNAHVQYLNLQVLCREDFFLITIRS